MLEQFLIPDVKNTMKLFDSLLIKLFAYCGVNLFAKIFRHGVHNKQI